MANVLIVYGTTEGQTAKIAQHIADAGRRLGHHVDVAHAPDLDADGTGIAGSAAGLAAYDAAIVGASVHEGHYQRAVAEFVERHRGWLSERPSAFFSVSMAAASRIPEEVAEVGRIIAAFTQDNGWVPTMTESFAGALKYTQYNWLKRMVMKHIAGRAGGSTDTEHDHEYTDWKQVDGFAERFFGSLGA